jgi:hypothetical protein
VVGYLEENYCINLFSIFNVVYHDFKPRSDQSKDYKIGISDFSAGPTEIVQDRNLKNSKI